MHVDHIVPVVVGGSDEIENLAAAHPACNLAKNAKSEDEFLASLLKRQRSADDQPLLIDELERSLHEEETEPGSGTGA